MRRERHFRHSHIANPYKRGTARTLGMEAGAEKANACTYGLRHADVWDGNSRPGWQANRSDGSLGGLHLLPGLCAKAGVACPAGTAAAERDHNTRFRQYISENAVPVEFCDGVCHFYGIRQDDASFWSNDTANLTPLCNACHTAKTQAEAGQHQEGGGAPTPIGPCPGPGQCQADVTL